jgi:tetratricopeptide (TPR) repeat protein
MANEDRGNSGRRSAGASARGGRNTTVAHPAYSRAPPVQAREPSAGDTRAVPAENREPSDAFHQHTALFDKGQFLGELADLVDGSPDTRVRVEAEPEPPKGFRLITVAGPEIGRTHTFTDEEVVIGRDGDCELPLTDIAVSRRHAKVVRDGPGFRLVDLDSNNGTFLNGQAASSTMLAPGDEVMIGERTFRFVELNEAPVDGDVEEAPGHVPDPAEVAPDSESAVRDPSGLPSQAAEAPAPERGRALRRVGLVAIGGVVFALLAGVGIYGWVSAERAAAAEQQARMLRTFVLQAIELTKTRRFGDAVILLQRVLELSPDDGRAQRYLDHAQQELEMWNHLVAGREALAAGRFSAARKAAARVDAESAYAPDAQALTRQIDRRAARSLVRRAHTAMTEGRFESAEDLVRRAEDQWPGVSGTLLDQIERRRPAPAPPPPPRRSTGPTVPEGLESVVQVYRRGQISSALDAAAAVGTAGARGWADRARRVRAGLERVRGLHQEKDGPGLLKALGPLRKLERSVGYGEGAVQAELRRMKADAHYLAGVGRQLAQDYAGAFRAFERALHTVAGHAASVARLDDLQARAQDVYYQALVAQPRDPERARSLLREVIASTRADARVHRMAARTLRRL